MIEENVGINHVIIKKYITSLLNKIQSMLTGAMVILVIEEPEGEYRSASFHVRFLRAKEQDIDICIYKWQKKNVKMKLASCGDAYFEYDQLAPYMEKQSKLIRQKEFNSTQIELMAKITGVHESKDEKMIKHQFKSFFPSSNQLKSLELTQGQNELRFVCHTSPSGVQTLSCVIYLWHYNNRC